MSIAQAKIAIITVTYNSSTFITDYLNSVLPFILSSPHRVIIVDNASTDTTCEMITHYSQQHDLQDTLHLIPLKKNIGFGKGCNAGIQAARSFSPSHFWFLNPDTRLYTNSGEALISLLQQCPHIDFAGSILVNEEHTPRAGAFRFPTLLNVILSTIKWGLLDKLLSSYTTAIPIQKNPYQADWLTGASFMAKAHCIYQLNGFDPCYFLYFEEVDLFFRAKKQGFSVWACPSSHVFHISGASTGINTQKNNRRRQPDYWFQSRRFFYIKNYGHLYFSAVDIALILCHYLWKIRVKIQKKDDNTPLRFVSDILRNGYPQRLFTRKTQKPNQ